MHTEQLACTPSYHLWGCLEGERQETDTPIGLGKMAIIQERGLGWPPTRATAFERAGRRPEARSRALLVQLQQRPRRLLLQLR